MANQDRVEPRNHGDFWSQVPVVLFTVAAVVAIVVVNSHARRAALPPAPVAPATEVHLDPVDCVDCGEVIAVRPASAQEVGATDPAQTGVIVDVRMSDGSVRAIKQFSSGFDVGDRVKVNGNALVARS